MLKNKHPEWDKENSLTSPLDRDRTKKYPIQTDEPQLTQEEIKIAKEQLCDNSFIKNFKRLDRRYVDPRLRDQLVGLVSFVPSKGAQPDSQGIYGWAKFRGSFENENESNKRAEYIIKNVDSYHKIYTVPIGRPFPLTLSSNFSKEVEEVDVKNSMTDSINNAVKKIKKQEQKQIDEIKQKEKNIQAEVKKENMDPFERYITLCVKKAQLTWSFAETHKKMIGMRKSILKCRQEIKNYDEEFPDFNKKYFDKYMDARKKAGVPVDKQTNEQKTNNWMKYMCEDIKLPFDPNYEYTKEDKDYFITTNPGPYFNPAPVRKNKEMLFQEYKTEKDKQLTNLIQAKTTEQRSYILKQIDDLDKQWEETDKNYYLNKKKNDAKEALLLNKNNNSQDKSIDTVTQIVNTPIITNLPKLKKQSSEPIHPT